MKRNRYMFVIGFIGLLKFISHGQVPFSNIDINKDRALHSIEKKFEDLQNDQESQAGGKANKFYQRWKNQMQPHLGEDGKIVNYVARNFKEKKRFLSRNPLTVVPQGVTRNVHGDWENIMPGTTNKDYPNNGRINCIAVHPTNPNVIFVGTPVGGIWVTYDLGGNWLNLNPGMDNLGVSSIVIRSDNPNVIYIATGGGDGFDTPSMGVLKSTNGGYDWVTTGMSFAENELINTYKMIADPGDPDVMFLATSIGIFKTTDGWNTETQEYSNKVVFDIEFKPGSSDTLYAGTNNTLARSYNGGDSWSTLNVTGSVPHTLNWSRVAVAVSEDAPDWIYVMFGRNAKGTGFWGYHRMFLSTDDGANFIMRDEDTDMVSTQCDYNLEMTIQPGAPNVVFLGAVNLWKSNNTGSTYTRIAVPDGNENIPKIHPDIHWFEWVGNRLFIGTDGGITYTDDFGVSYVNITDGLTINQIYDIAIKDNQYMAGSQDCGTHDWHLGDPSAYRTLGGDGLECFYDPSENVRYASTQSRRYRSVNGGNWIDISPPSQLGDIWKGVFTHHPTNYDTIFSAAFDIARSFDQGQNWTIFDPGFNRTDLKIETLVMSRNNPNRMYISNLRELKLVTNIHLSKPNFINIDNGLPMSSLNISSMAVNPNDVNEIWVGFYGYGDGMKVYKSTTGGQGVDPWVNVTANLPNVPVYCIEYLPGSNNGIYIGTDFGVFYKDDSMTNWAWFSAGLPKTRVEDLVVHEGYLYAGTFGRGMWRTPHVGSCPVNLTLTSANDQSPSYSTGTQFHSASYGIYSDRIITGGQGTDVTYSAGNFVTLAPGFHAEANNNFKASLDGCPD
ncbi:3-coathanger stack domain-containing protein [Portibacter marinus]|uniref:3-coathanger stack domain-containing protein n=1 Tax=Portibacter marinus TaxID=2898660 RepID=UPI001F2D46AB|nr:3-coathanger stack domain-containing protein [Portibacter marinus]